MLEGESYVSYEKSHHIWRLDDGSNTPDIKHFKNPHWDEDTRTFTAIQDWAPQSFYGATVREYKLVFNEDFTKIVGGEIQGKNEQGQVIHVIPTGTYLDYRVKRMRFILED